MGYADDLLERARYAYLKAREAGGLSEKESYLYEALHLAKGAREHGVYDASALIRDIESYANQLGLDIT